MKVLLFNTLKAILRQITQPIVCMRQRLKLLLNVMQVFATQPFKTGLTMSIILLLNVKQLKKTVC